MTEQQAAEMLNLLQEIRDLLRYPPTEVMPDPEPPRSEGDDPPAGQSYPYHMVEGGIGRVHHGDLDPRIVKAIQLSQKYGEPWELYEDSERVVRIMVSGEIAARMRSDSDQG